MNYKLTLCYEGARYRGWQRQGNTPDTVQARLEAALEQIAGQPVEVHGSGRTDAGVHAKGQVASFHADTALSPQELLRRLRAALPEDIGALALETAPERFHARLSCTGKTYVYRLWCSERPNVFDRRTVQVCTDSLDETAMRQAADFLIGTHDFRAFCGNPHMKKSTIRTLNEIRFTHTGEELQLWFTGNGFLQNMVRLLTGTLLAVGRGALSPAETALILDGQLPCPPMAPARGLTLWEVFYP